MSSRPNVVVLVLDSARGDWVPSSPSGEATFGPVKRWADDRGVWFDNAHALSITSAPSMGSLMTGLYPFKHGLLPATGELPERVETIPGRLSEAGYHTIGVSANVHFSPHTNLDRGFETFKFLPSDPIQFVKEVGLGNAIKFGLKIRSESAGFETPLVKHTVTPLLNKLIYQCIDESSNERPFFLVAHYIEPHQPYYPPRKLLDTKKRRRQADLSYRIHDEMYERMAAGCRLTAEEWDALKSMYALELQYTSEQVSDVLTHIEETTDRETIFVVTADHGDLFGEQGFIFHGQPLHDKLTHVPLVTRGVPVTDPAAPTTHLDLMKTVVSLTGCEPVGLDGVNLASRSSDRFVTQRNYSQEHRLVREHNPEYVNEYTHEQPVTAFHADGYKLKVSADRTTLLNLDADPREEHLLDLDEEPGAEALTDWSNEWFDEHGRSVGEVAPASLDRSTERHLEEMGYL